MSKNTLVGVADGRVWFVSDRGHGDIDIYAYFPVSQERFDDATDVESVIDNNIGDICYYWKEAVANDETTDGLREYASYIFELEKADHDQLWFYGQDMYGPGEVMCRDMDLHEELHDLFDKLYGDDAASWEVSIDFGSKSNCVTSLPEEWDFVYDPECASMLDMLRISYRPKVFCSDSDFEYEDE